MSFLGLVIKILGMYKPVALVTWMWTWIEPLFFCNLLMNQITDEDGRQTAEQLNPWDPSHLQVPCIS